MSVPCRASGAGGRRGRDYDNNDDLAVNPEGSIDLWFGPTAPRGRESNWVQTVPGKAWSVALRLYGPEDAWFEKTWRPGEIEMVE